MNLADAKTQLEALPGVYDLIVSADHVMCLTEDDLDTKPEYVRLCVYCASSDLLPEETRQGILRICETLESKLGCTVSFSVSAGLRMPDWAKEQINNPTEEPS